MKIKVKKLHQDAIIPVYQTKGASGFDLHALEDVNVYSKATMLIKTGLSFEISEGYEMQVRPRSGMSLKTKIRVSNSPGTVDSDYRGEVCVIIDNLSDSEFFIKKGDRIAQGVICPIVQAEIDEVENLSLTERGENGFGSTNK